MITFLSFVPCEPEALFYFLISVFFRNYIKVERFCYLRHEVLRGYKTIYFGVMYNIFDLYLVNIHTMYNIYIYYVQYCIEIHMLAL